MLQMVQDTQILYLIVQAFYGMFNLKEMAVVISSMVMNLMELIFQSNLLESQFIQENKIHITMLILLEQFILQVLNAGLAKILLFYSLMET